MRFPRLRSEPRNLWPSNRGTEIGHIAAGFDAVETGLRRRTAARDGAVFEGHGPDLRAILLKRLAGQRIVTIVEEAAHAPGLLSVVADGRADPAPILEALRLRLRGIADVQASVMDRPFPD